MNLTSSIWLLAAGVLLVAEDPGTHARQQSLATGWAINSSPGPPPGSAGIHPGIVAIHDDPLRKPAVRNAAFQSTEVWVKPLEKGHWAVALFNNGDRLAQVDVIWKELGLSGSPRVRDLWTGRDRGKVHGGFAEKLPPHGSALFKIVP